MSVLQRFFSYVEIKTKITSVFPFLMTLSYLFSSGIDINLPRSLVFFFGMFLFDLTATTINNFFDSKKNSQKLQFSRRTCAAITAILLLLSVFFGIWLVLLTDIAVLFLGALCFLFGIFYSWGPVPISHGPYGELVSGLFYGLLIPAILLYINVRKAFCFPRTFQEALFGNALPCILISGILGRPAAAFRRAVLPYGKHHACKQSLRHAQGRIGSQVYASSLYQRPRDEAVCLFILPLLRFRYRNGCPALVIPSEHPSFGHSDSRPEKHQSFHEEAEQGRNFYCID
jgi:hypothetical protein